MLELASNVVHEKSAYTTWLKGCVGAFVGASIKEFGLHKVLVEVPSRVNKDLGEVPIGIAFGETSNISLDAIEGMAQFTKEILGKRAREVYVLKEKTNSRSRLGRHRGAVPSVGRGGYVGVGVRVRGQGRSSEVNGGMGGRRVGGVSKIAGGVSVGESKK